MKFKNREEKERNNKEIDKWYEKEDAGKL